MILKVQPSLKPWCHCHHRHHCHNFYRQHCIVIISDDQYGKTSYARAFCGFDFEALILCDKYYLCKLVGGWVATNIGQMPLSQ